MSELTNEVRIEIAQGLVDAAIDLQILGNDGCANMLLEDATLFYEEAGDEIDAIRCINLMTDG